MNDLATPTEPAPHLTRHDQALREKAQALLAHADVRIDGDRPWDLQVHDERVFARTFAQLRAGRKEIPLFNFGQDIETLRANCLAETGLPAPRAPQWQSA